MALCVLMGCSDGDARQPEGVGPKAHISDAAVQGQVLPELDPTVVLQISFFDREGAARHRVRVHDDGRVQRAQAQDSWALSMTLSATALQALRDGLVSTELATVSGAHGLDPAPSDAQRHIIQAPKLAQGVTVVTDGRCQCAPLKAFYREVMPMLRAPAK